MQSLDDLSDFGKRVKALGLQWKALARCAGVAPSTALRIGRGDSDGHVSTARKLNHVLEAEELRIALHLMSLPHVKAALAEAHKHPEAA